MMRTSTPSSTFFFSNRSIELSIACGS